MGYTRKQNNKWFYQQTINGKQVSKYIGSDEAKLKHEADLAKLEQRKTDLTKSVKTPDRLNGEFSVLYADPPWQYDFSETDSRAIENQYATMTVSDICRVRRKIPIAQNAVLFLWATAPKLREALQVMVAWGFSYKTNAIWDKQKIGMGYWFRGQHELLLVGVRGEWPAPQHETRHSSVIRETRGDHSSKPLLVYDLIETMCPVSKYLELFARVKHSDKWEVWGNEAPRG